MVGFTTGCCNRTGAHHSRRARVQGRGSGGAHGDRLPRSASRSSREGVAAAGGCEDNPSSPSTAPLLADEHERKEGEVASDGRGDGPLFSFKRCPSTARVTATTTSAGTCGDGASGVVRDLASLKEVLEGVEGSRGRAQEDEDAMCGEPLPLTANGARRRRRATRTPPRRRRRRRSRARERPRMTRAPARRRHPRPRSREAMAGGGGAAFLRDSRGTPIVRDSGCNVKIFEEEQKPPNLSPSRD
uniref:Uncharacterized protein n=1 Tax=Setaria viridis TaxID=4556 RepID=A0A4U6V5G2_SETVI|nr:hypothetical protein SEVIR_4G209300v2 [Setaria viridis]